MAFWPRTVAFQLAERCTLYTVQATTDSQKAATHALSKKLHHANCQKSCTTCTVRKAALQVRKTAPHGPKSVEHFHRNVGLSTVYGDNQPNIVYILMKPLF